MANELSHRLRINATKSERMMWNILKPLRMQGWHFRRQVPIGGYYADFACLHAKLLIEVDGGSHDFTHAADADRDDYMRSRGINVLRVTNDDVLHNPDGVLAHVASVLGSVSRSSNTPTLVPSPQGGGRPD
jgi:very-short-patch-repair endonuclease